MSEKVDGLPDSYVIGQEYVDDHEIPVAISWSLYTAALFDGFVLERPVRIQVERRQVAFNVQLRTSMASALFDALSQRSIARGFIIGQISAVLPLINERVMQHKYLSGHLLARGFSMLDVWNVSVLNEDSGGEVAVPWPLTIKPFPPSDSLAKSSDKLYIRDLIDAVTAYFTYDHDGCVQRLITSLENFFLQCNLKGTFRERLNQCLDPNHYFSSWGKYLDVLKDNTEFIYQVRNKICHAGFRLDPGDRPTCKAGIRTLMYMFQRLGVDTNEARYVVSLMTQFLLLDDKLDGLSLEITTKVMEPECPVSTINTPEDLNRILFEGLRIPEVARRAVRARMGRSGG